MSNNNDDNERKIIEGKTDALVVAALPAEQSEIVYEKVLENGLKPFNDHNQVDNPIQKLSEKVDEFGVKSLYKFKSRQSVKDHDDLIVVDPIQIMIRAGFAAIVMDNHERVNDIPSEYIKLIDYVAREYARQITGILHSPETDGFDKKWILELVGNELYASSSPKKETHPGIIIEDFPVTFDNKPGQYLEMPLVSSSPKALIYSADETWEAHYDSQTKSISGRLHSFVRNNNLYIPYRHIKWKHYHKIADDFREFVDWLKEKVTEDELEILLQNTPEINDEIESFFRRNKEGAVARGWSEEEKLVRVLQDILVDSKLNHNEPHSASQLKNLLDAYNLDGWKQAVANDVNSPKQLGKRLTVIADESGPPDVTVRETDEGNRNQYLIGSVAGETEKLAVNEIEDLFDLPCFNNLDERLKTKGPTRWELYSFVRTVSWLPEYYEANLKTKLDDLKDTFERWPWYDEQETEYQIRYELTGTNNLQRKDPDADVLPLNCNNENWRANYCIGTDECPFYTMYRALPFHEDLYNQLPESK